MKIFGFVILATVLEAFGDAVIRVSLHRDALGARAGFFALGVALLAAYGTSLNLAPVDFGTVTGLYVAMVFMSFQVTNYVFFSKTPTPATLVGGAFILVGGSIIYLWR